MKTIILTLLFILPDILLSQWVVSNSGTTVNLTGIYFINSNTGYACGQNGMLIRTTNSGQSWSGALATGLTDNINSVYFINAATGIACGASGKIIRTTNSGVNWTGVITGVDVELRSISLSGLSGVCSGSEGTLLYTTDSGVNWTVAKNGFISNMNGALMYSGNLAFTCGVNTIFQPLFGKSTNGGANWSYTTFYLNTNEGGLTDIHFISENEGFATAYVFDGRGAISHTSNGGSNWTTEIFPFLLTSIDFAGINIGFAAGDNGLILKTTNKGLSWETQPGPLSGLFKSIDFVDSLNGFAAGDNGTIIKTVNGGVTLINNINLKPGNFFLHQNYPNPFNPSTVIRYDLKTSGNISIVIYDTEGKEVQTLIDAVQSAGNYSVKLEASHLSSGVYFYSLKSGKYSQTRSLLLLR